MIWMLVSVLFEWILLDGLFDIEFISKVPDGGGKLHSKLIHWEDYLLSKHPVAQKAATLLIYFIFPFIVLGYIASSGLTAWFRSLYQGRMMLRSLAARREANNEAYCSLLWFAIWVEVHSVVIPAYIPFIGPATFVFHYGANLVQVAKYYVILDVIIKFQQISLWFVHWLFCLTPDQINVTTQYYAGKRAVDEMDAAFYLYMWSFWVVMIGNMVGWGFELRVKERKKTDNPREGLTPIYTRVLMQVCLFGVYVRWLGGVSTSRHFRSPLQGRRRG